MDKINKLILAEGPILDAKRQNLLSFLVSLTGSKPTRLIEHRIYVSEPMQRLQIIRFIENHDFSSFQDLIIKRLYQKRMIRFQTL